MSDWNNNQFFAGEDMEADDSPSYRSFAIPADAQNSTSFGDDFFDADGPPVYRSLSFMSQPVAPTVDGNDIDGRAVSVNNSRPRGPPDGGSGGHGGSTPNKTQAQQELKALVARIKLTMREDGTWVHDNGGDRTCGKMEQRVLIEREAHWSKEAAKVVKVVHGHGPSKSHRGWRLVKVQALCGEETRLFIRPHAKVV
jgi:hypothetical protein